MRFVIWLKIIKDRQTVHAAAILGNREDAADAVQEAFVDAFKSLKNFDKTRRFYPWFYVLLRNRCYKMTAKRREIEDIEETEILAAKSGISFVETIALERDLLSFPVKENLEIISSALKKAGNNDFTVNLFQN